MKGLCCFLIFLNVTAGQAVPERSEGWDRSERKAESLADEKKMLLDDIQVHPLQFVFVGEMLAFELRGLVVLHLFDAALRLCIPHFFICIYVM